MSAPEFYNSSPDIMRVSCPRWENSVCIRSEKRFAFLSVHVIICIHGCYACHLFEMGEHLPVLSPKKGSSLCLLHSSTTHPRILRLSPVRDGRILLVLGPKKGSLFCLSVWDNAFMDVTLATCSRWENICLC
jgi:hypothetical protein